MVYALYGSELYNLAVSQLLRTVLVMLHMMRPSISQIRDYSVDSRIMMPSTTSGTKNAEDYEEQRHRKLIQGS